MRTTLTVVVFLVFIFMVACTTEVVYAPVVDANIEMLPKKGVYQVRSDDTLYSIAWRYGLDYRDLAKINHIVPPYFIKAGQLVYLQKSSGYVKPTSALAVPKKVSAHPANEKEPTRVVSHWHWPARGKLIKSYSELNKGLDISGHMGESILATAPGKVVYSGNGLRSYGNLIIIKHNSTYLSAYAHNDNILVKEGQQVKAGQKIAEMGRSGTRRVMLHFEIRHKGKPVNPLAYLAKK